MVKADLKRLWGHYCDTDKLVNDVMALLTKYHHENTENGVCEMLNVYFHNKQNLIDMFATSKHYIGNMRICLDTELERRTNESDICIFCDNFVNDVEARNIFLKFVDEYGKSLKDYTRTGVSQFKAKQLHYGNILGKLMVNTSARQKFLDNGATKESHMKLDTFHGAVSSFRWHTSSTLTRDVVDMLTQYEMNVTFAEGMKTSRAFNRMCTHYGVDKLPNYNRLFAQYSDMVSGLKRKVKFYLSLNPLDYLTMSFGNSWSSCHTIDKQNERGMPNSYQGMHAGGCVSYMLDSTSIITYVHNHATEDHEEGKIYRNMFHFNNGTLLQGRIYPQGNDGATDLYREFRRIVQGEFTNLLNLEGDDWIKRTCACDHNTATTGNHYPDYLNFSECNVSYPREMPSAAENILHIGHKRICPKCGYEIDNSNDSGMLTHCRGECF